MIKKILWWIRWAKETPKPNEKEWSAWTISSNVKSEVHKISTQWESPKIEFSPELAKQYWLEELIAWHNNNEELWDKRLHKRANSKDILDMDILVNITRDWTAKICTDLLSNISWGWIQIVSEKEREIWDELNLNFLIKKFRFNFKWIIVTKEEWPNKNVKYYWIKFINPPEDKTLLIEQIVASIIHTAR